MGGEINTYGGGFCSIRAKTDLPAETKSIRVSVKGDGKTYKLTLSNGSKSMMGGMSWQADIPTDAGKEEIHTFDLTALKPSFGGRSSTSADTKPFVAGEMKEIGFMLSLKLSDGSSNPKETFGEGIFPFSFKIKSIEPI